MRGWGARTPRAHPTSAPTRPVRRPGWPRTAGARRTPVAADGGSGRDHLGVGRGVGRGARGKEQGMTRNTLSDVAAYIREQAAAYCAASKVPGYLAGVYHDGEQTVVAHGVANVATGAPMREDTGFLFGSVTKV